MSLRSVVIAAAVPALALPALTGSAVGVAAEGVQPTGGRTQPNIILVLADDMGWADLSTGLASDGHHSDFNETPAIERLAVEGTAFSDAYFSPNCAPSRTALLTGLSAPRPTNSVYAVDGLNRGGDQTLLVGPAQGDRNGDDALNPEAATVGETVQTAGYVTGYVGKFHVTASEADITAVHGFDENLGGSTSGQVGAYHAVDGRFDGAVAPSLDRFGGDYTQEYVDEQVAPYATGVDGASLDALVGSPKHVTDAVTDAAIDFIDRHDEEPFFTVVSHYAVHNPVRDREARSDLLDKYRAKPAGLTPHVPAYAALLEGVDQSVARLVHHLETTADPRNPGATLAENSVVLFASDNGGRRAIGSYNGPLAGEKGELRDGGIRVPLIAWSGSDDLVLRGRVNESVVDATDIHPTIAGLAHAEPPAGARFDGDDLSRVLSTGSPLDRPFFLHLPGYLIDGQREQRPQSLVRSGRWKLRYDYEQQRFQLHDLEADPGETTDLAAERPEVVHRLGLVLIRWLDEVDAPLATLRPGREPIDVEVDGIAYANRTVSRVDGTLTVDAGEELPFVLPRR